MSPGVGDVADELSRVVRESVSRLDAIGEPESLQTRGPGTWSRKQILGHLIDSALNNLHRFVRAQQVEELSFPDYDQPAWVAAGGYQDRPWAALTALWAGLNEHLAHVIARIPGERLETTCRIGRSQPMTLEFIVRDYVKHLRHHLEQILDPEAARGRTHPPFAQVRVLTIRPERPLDQDAIRSVNRAAFGRDDEARLVDALRGSPAFVPELSLVAEIDGAVQGHILFSRVGIRAEAAVVPALALAPMAVTPGHQRRGIGSALVRRGLDDARELGHRIVIVVGHPEYYPRFGFERASRRGVKTPFPAPDEAVRLLELAPGALAGAGEGGGTVLYPPEFEGE